MERKEKSLESNGRGFDGFKKRVAHTTRTEKKKFFEKSANIYPNEQAEGDGEWIEPIIWVNKGKLILSTRGYYKTGVNVITEVCWKPQPPTRPVFILPFSPIYTEMFT